MTQKTAFFKESSVKGNLKKSMLILIYFDSLASLKKNILYLRKSNSEKYDRELKELEGKTRCDHKRKKLILMKPKQGFIVAAVREFYTDLSKVKQDNPNLVKALKFAKPCYEKYLANNFEGEEPPKKRFRESGAGRKCKAPEVREAIFEWFINVRGVLKGRLQQVCTSRFTQNG